MDNSKKNLGTVPFVVYETAQARNERREKRLFAIILVLIVLLVGSNVAWLWYESQFETVTTTTQEVIQENEGGYNSFIGGDMYGYTESQDNNNEDTNP